jgi:two-component system cell cycle sensor histidine kinase/response regulator CckA
MKPMHWKFLIIDDNPIDRELVIRKLQREFEEAKFEEVGRQAQLDTAITRGDFDLVLTDYHLNWADGLEILRKVKEHLPHVPVVMFTGTGNEEVAVEGMKSGLSNYVLKRHLQHLPFAVKDSLEKARLQQQYEETISQLRESEERYRELFEQGLTAVFACQPDGTLLTCNAAFASIFGCSSIEEAMSKTLASFYATVEAYQSFLALLQKEKRLVSYEAELCRTDGEIIYVVGNIVGTFDTEGKLVEIKGYLFDNTERMRLEARYRQAQKMESLGQLVSGIAHDFNNMLGGILGHSSRCLSRVTENHPLYDNLYHIHDIAEKAARMTRQLLAFSRRQVLEPKDIDINVVISELLNFIGKLIADHVEIIFTPEPALLAVHADATQIEQVVMNLCINARDAMPKGGKLYISTDNVIVDRNYQRKHPDAHLGKYILLKVSDTGIGMDEKIREHAFEPFFTTKEPGKGTGLGLSTVHGIVGQHNGFIEVESKVDKGTTFSIYLPALEMTAIGQEAQCQPVPTEAAAKADDALSLQQTSAGYGYNKKHGSSQTQTILLVEDDPDLRYLMQVVLQESGYEVLSAADGSEGLEQFKQHSSRITMVVSDMITPRMRGKELYDSIHELNPEIQFLFVSGYQANQISQNFVLEEGFKFLPKPFDLDELTAKVREVLEFDEALG